MKINYILGLLFGLFGAWLFAIGSPSIYLIGMAILCLVCFCKGVMRISCGASAIVLALLLCLLAPNARAGESFNTTNVILTGVTQISYPTNAAGLKTGSGVSVQNYSDVGIEVEGDVYTSNATHVVNIDLVRTGFPNPPAAATNWNNDAMTKLVVTLPAVTNGHYRWSTNLDLTFIAPATFIGIMQITNNLTATETVSNFVVRVIKKPTIVQFP